MLKVLVTSCYYDEKELYSYCWGGGILTICCQIRQCHSGSQFSMCQASSVCISTRSASSPGAPWPLWKMILFRLATESSTSSTKSKSIEEWGCIIQLSSAQFTEHFRPDSLWSSWTNGSWLDLCLFVQQNWETPKKTVIDQKEQWFDDDFVPQIASYI